MDIEWRDGHRLIGLSSGALLDDGRQLSTSTYTTHELEKSQPAANDTAAREYTIRSTASGLPDLLQHIWLYNNQPAIAIQAELVSKAKPIGTRHFDSVLLNGAASIDIGESKSLRLLHVPFDNDM